MVAWMADLIPSSKAAGSPPTFSVYLDGKSVRPDRMARSNGGRLDTGGDGSIPGAAGEIGAHGVFQAGDQPFLADRLAQEPVRPVPHCGRAHVLLGVCRHEDRRDAVPRVVQAPLQLDAA